MKVRIYKLKDGTIIIDTPVPRFQDNLNNCPHPWRFRSSNPNKEDFELTIVDASTVINLANGNNEAGSGQFYHIDGEVKHDHTWDEILMPKSTIVKKHYKRLQRELSEELATQMPDVIKIAKAQAGMIELKDICRKGLQDVDVYKIALSNLEAENKKPKIQAALKRKLEY